MDQKVIDKFWSSIEKTNYCWNWTGFLDKAKLPVIRVSNGIVNGKISTKEYSPRQISKYLEGEDLSEKKHCLPTCGNKLCVNPEHLARGDSARFWAKVHKLNEPNGCWIWLAGEDKNGYGKFTAVVDGKKTTLKAHAYSWELYTGRPVPNNILVCHTCDTPRCVNPHHLWLGTNRDNTEDRHQKKRDACGEDNGASKLTTEQVLEIRDLYHNKEIRVVDIAIKYHCGKSTISDIVLNKRWKHLL